MLVESQMKELGTHAPSFNLLDVRSGRMVDFDTEASSKATVVMFICNHCPYVRHVAHKLAKIAKEYQKKGVAFIAISANDINEYPEDAPEKMKEYAEQIGYTFPYLYDEDQSVAQAYGAVCTPDFFVYDGERTLAYRGRMDAATPGNNVSVTGEELLAALNALIHGKRPSENQHASMGCSIKWKD